MTAIAMVKGERPALDRTWMTFADGETRRVAVHVVHDLPHLVVESLFGIDDGLWGILARGGFSHANRQLGRAQPKRIRLVTDAPLDDLAREHWVAHLVAKAATNAVTNRWGDGPDTPEGVRRRLSPGSATVEPAATVTRAEDAEAYRLRLRLLLDQLDDATIQQAIDGVRALDARWRSLRPGETLQVAWPLRTAPLPG